MCGIDVTGIQLVLLYSLYALTRQGVGAKKAYLFFFLHLACGFIGS